MDVKKRKISLLIPNLSLGGTEGVCVKIANGLALRGWTVDLVLLNVKNDDRLHEVSKSVNIKILSVNDTRASFFQLRKYLKVWRPNKVIGFNYPLVVMLVVVSKTLNFPISIWGRNNNTLSQLRYDFFKYPLKYFYQCIGDYFYQKSDFIINQCLEMQEDFITVFPKMHNKTDVIYNPIDFNDLPQNSSMVKKDLLCVGRFVEQKSFHYAIMAFAKVSKFHPKIRLRMVGDGPLLEKLQWLSRDLQVDDKVLFTGRQNEVGKYYDEAIATILTSQHEGFPNVLLESIASGTPIVSFDCKSGPAEIIIDGVNGYLVKKNCVDDLAEKLNAVIVNGLDSQAVIKTAERFNKDHIISEYESLLLNR